MPEVTGDDNRLGGHGRSAAGNLEGMPHTEADVGILKRNALALLDQKQRAAPAGGSYSVAYARGRYEVFERYVERLNRLGFANYDSGLDIGSGAGHWSLAFALVNARAEGVDKSPEFVELARRLATHVGLTDRVRFRVGPAENLPFGNESFPVAWAHSVLNFTDVEVAMAEAARVLAPMGLFYCGNSSYGFRIEAVWGQLVANRLEAAERQVWNLMAFELYECGINRSGWGTTRSPLLEDLIEIAAVFGLTVVAQPGVQDGRAWVVGHRGTVDFLARRDRTPDAVREELIAADQTVLLATKLNTLISIGCPRLVVEVLDAREEEWLGNPALADAYLRAIVKSGQVANIRAGSLDPSCCDPLSRGLLHHQRGEYPTALDCYIGSDDSRHEKTFLIAAALLAMDQDSAAERYLCQGLANPESERACRTGLMVIAARRHDLPQLKLAFADFLQAIAERTGATEEAREKLSQIR